MNKPKVSSSKSVIDAVNSQMDVPKGGMMKRRIWNAKKYYQAHGISKDDVVKASWRKSSLSAYNGSCLEVTRFPMEIIGVRDTKDKGKGPVLVFTHDEWHAFVTGVKAGEFDLF